MQSTIKGIGKKDREVDIVDRKEDNTLHKTAALTQREIGELLLLLPPLLILLFPRPPSALSLARSRSQRFSIISD